MAEREFSDEYRAELAREGKAMPDGSYPTPDEDALERAFEAYGRETPEKRPALRRYLVRRAHELDRADLIPASWTLRKGVSGGADR